MIELLLKLEMSLWIKETRNNYDYLDKILHKNFKEFGMSGSIFSKEDILNNLDLNLESKFPFKNLEVKQIDEISYLITYQAEVIEKTKSIKSNRSSIWIGRDSFQLLFHQGTLTE
ncbi:hypothetical protein KQ51_01136 [Candidatus Izimaplasma bacterium HR1]|jgi:hypothetical protein|uniref:nuclear transport factor 2 family protein n=1 Tax=Candidatus Izimoplasma sp. HR1 TaxID=1541959 RepID=UPI0004F5A83C|nr:hypothetical protein KQ51_01136 [Candidatus Izimaplasma bacterium HR1]